MQVNLSFIITIYIAIMEPVTDVLKEKIMAEESKPRPLALEPIVVAYFGDLVLALQKNLKKKIISLPELQQTGQS